jgi:CubicO group peptidase (beta-lactamase class C family)
LQGKPLTLRNLLTHSAGLNMASVDEFVPGKPCPTLLDVLNGTGGVTQKLAAVEEPGRRVLYSGGGYCVLQQVAEDATGERYADFMRQSVLEPLGMDSSTFEQDLPSSLRNRAAAGHDELGAVLEGGWRVHPQAAAAGLWSTPQDVARFAIELRREYLGQSDRVLDNSLARAMLTPQVEYMGLGPMLSLQGASPRIFHSGGTDGYRCFMVMRLSSGDGIVVMTNASNGDRLVNELLRSAAREYDIGPF